jgi:ribosomal protein L3 glutamine methyltransferase
MTWTSEQISRVETFEELIRWGERLFIEAGLTFGHGTDNPWDEAAQLVLAAAGFSPARTTHDLKRLLQPKQKQAAVELLLRRVKTREPAAYLLRRAWFAGLEFYVDARVLIPRSPIAELIENQLEPWVRVEGVHRVLDLCTGSGCLGIACAYAFPEAAIDLADVSDAALEVARINVERHVLRDRVRVIQSDLFEQLGGQCYDLILANPPYVDEKSMAALPEEYCHEPKLGLAGGGDGLRVARRILNQAADHLNANGVLIMEAGNSARALAGRYPEVPFMWLDFARGGHGVFVLTHTQCKDYFRP